MSRKNEKSASSSNQSGSPDWLAILRAAARAISLVVWIVNLFYRFWRED